MSIVCYPLEPDDAPGPPPRPSRTPPPPPVQVPPAARVQQQPVNFFDGETSECNYLVLIFVVGVLFLAFTDSMKR